MINKKQHVIYVSTYYIRFSVHCDVISNASLVQTIEATGDSGRAPPRHYTDMIFMRGTFYSIITYRFVRPCDAQILFIRPLQLPLYINVGSSALQDNRITHFNWVLT